MVQLSVQDPHRPVFYFLSLLAGLYAFLVIIAIFLPGGIIEREEMLIFILGWPVSSISAILSVILLKDIQEKYFRETARPLWVLLAFNALFFTILTTGLNLSWQWGKSTAVMVIVYAAVLIVPLANALLIWLMKSSPFNFPIAVLHKLSLLGCFGFINFFVLVPDPQLYQTPLPLLLIALLCGVAATTIKSTSFPIHRNRLIIFGLDIFVVLMIILACFDPAFSIDIDHQNFYLGPANRILHGGTMLVDTFSQYGVLVIYFISIVFKTGIIPFTYQGLSLVVALLFMLHFIMLYVLLIALFNNRLYAILLLGIIILLGFFGTMGQIQVYPSTGPMRFELAYLILTMVYIRKRFRIVRRYGMLMEYFLVGIASLWSFETFVYTAFPYLGICLYESLSQPARLSQSAKNFFRRLLWFFLTPAVFQSVFLLFTFFRSGKLPDWGTYLGFVNAYSSVGGEFGTMLIYPWSYWFLIISIYFAALAAFLFRFFFQKDLDDSPQSVFMCGLTLLGIAIFTYFLGRSHPNNLYHISTPLVIIAGYGYAKLNKSSIFPEIFRHAAKFAFYSAVILIFLVQTPVFWKKAQQNHTGYQITVKSIYSIIRGGDTHFWETEQNILKMGSGNQQVTEALSLLQKYTPHQKYATVFLSPANSTEILMRSGRVQHFPINDFIADTVSVKFFRELVNYPQVLKENDFVFLLQDPLAYKNDININKVQIYMIDRLCREFRFQEVETSPSGVTVIKLQPYNTIPVPYCETIQSLKNSIPK